MWFIVKSILPRLLPLLNSFQRFELSSSSWLLQVFGCENRRAFCDGECCQWNYQSSHVPLIWPNVWFLCDCCFHLAMHLHWFPKYLWVIVMFPDCFIISKFQLKSTLSIALIELSWYCILLQLILWSYFYHIDWMLDHLRNLNNCDLIVEVILSVH